MKRPTSIRTTTRDFVSPYRWGEHKWEDYLFDTQALIYGGAQAQIEATSKLRLVVEAGNAQQSEMLRAFQQHAADAGVAWNRIADQLDGLNDTLVTGFTTLEHKLEYHGQLLESIAGKLDRIVFALEHKLDTEAKELFHNGRKLLERQLYPEALADFQAAEAKRPVNPLLQLHLAQIHYHIRDDAVPFDYAIAEQHIALAMRYVRALRVDLGSEGKQTLDLVYRTAAHIALVKGGDAANSGDIASGKTELVRSRELLAAIDDPSPSSRFLAAQVEALLGQSGEAVDRVRSLADYMRSWIPRALLEPDLSSVAEDIGKMAKQLELDPGPHSKSVRETVETARLFAKRAASTEVHSPSRCAQLEEDVDRTLARFESGDIDAPAARQGIISQLDKTRHAIRAELKDAFARYDTEASQQMAVAASTWASATRKYSIEETIGLTGTIMAAFFVALIVGLVQWSQVAFFLTLLIICVPAAIGVYVHHEMKSAGFRTQAKQADAWARTNRENAYHFNQRLHVLSRVETELKLK